MPLLLLALSLSLVTVVQTAPIFGTENGYDAGGTEPICFTSKLNLANRSTDSQKGSLEDLNEELFEGQSTEFELLRRCFEGTDLDVEPLGLAGDRLLETGSNYTFRVTLQVLLSQISDKIPQLGNSTIFVRFLLCDAIKQGFCNPLQDTRELDQNVRPSDTDFDASETDSFEGGDNKWRYQQGNALLGIADGLIVLSRWVKWTLREVENDSDLYKTSVDITLQLPEGIRQGAYFFIGHVVMNFDVGDGLIERVDIADAIPDNVLEVRNPPTIHKVSDSMKIIVGVATGIFGSFALFCFGAIIYYRDSTVMKLAQGSFLAALAGCCMIAIAFTFTFLPSRDVFCSLRGPMTLIPITTAAAILVARTWRIYVTLSVALSLGREGKKGKTGPELGQRLMMLLGCVAQFPFLLFQNLCKRKRSMPSRVNGSLSSSMPSLRRAVTAEEAVSLVVILSFPQVFLQVFAALYYEKELELDFDPTVNVGRTVCSKNGIWAAVAGWCIIAAVFLLAVTVSWISRMLPSAFNEKDHVFLAAAISTIIAVIALPLYTIADAATTSPDVEVLLWSICSIGVSTSVLAIMVWPKIRRVRSGEKVVMSKILGSNFNGSSLSSSSSAETGSNFRSRITVKKDDPLPRQLETDIILMEELLRGVTNACAEGRPLSLDDWKRMRIDVAKLHDELGQIDLGWTEDDLTDSIAKTAAIKARSTAVSSDVESKVAVDESSEGREITHNSERNAAVM